ncbi:hypothetical protein [Paenibacillus mucilaginosus]|uniref:Uncharacterized protein n=3 Tax=Paenibacillus mucilaginosus TaxID=61624 RepID=H6N972_9BACL|nr:hypothetical protein [Paenibacillus mucilaginosus]AEI39569.1 hypothetical protein KNP414_00979 [Paenibacillus mucilaginosus KNP414]AFC27818.1 hypothetical protein PM3016_870 [Paenibacillus mucilaginosus 3016]AFH59971.1 hypothetical protein B2K_04420 [Paenibacillus mucilaginosus K02]MCG7214618.1 hypothetical protein [Paenibacillus mucilaginosus]WDM28521.1 hypothetical protein KCX80_04550 [Paenibacillus mucilaginosus]
MMDSIALLLLAACIAYKEIPRMRRARRHRDLLVFTVMLLAGTILGILQSARVPLPNPLDWMTMVYRPVSQGVDALIGWREPQ